MIIHKIDRSARNLKDWADLGELIDQGIDVHFANESLDLHSRGGRLSADIQAVVAADYTCIREEIVEEYTLQKFAPLQFHQREKEYSQKKITELRNEWGKQQETQIKALTLRLDQLQDRLARLTDAYIDKVIEKEIFEERKTALLLERKDLEEKQRELKENGRRLPDRLAEFLELAGSVYLNYKLGLAEEKRDLVKIATSNRDVDRKNVDFMLSLPFSEVANRFQNSNSVPARI